MIAALSRFWRSLFPPHEWSYFDWGGENARRCSHCDAFEVYEDDYTGWGASWVRAADPDRLAAETDKRAAPPRSEGANETEG